MQHKADMKTDTKTDTKADIKADCKLMHKMQRLAIYLVNLKDIYKLKTSEASK